MKKALFVYLKYPEEGKVKTRLATDVGDKRASEIYKELAEKTIKNMESLVNKGIEVIISFTPIEKEKEIKEWIGKQFVYHLQKGNDLGEKMSNTVQYGFKKGADKIVIIGTDCPTISSNHIEEAFLMLSNNDVVIGPAFDGGYYLIGVKKGITFLFNDIDWSTSSVLKQTIEKINSAGLTFDLLRTMHDIDSVEDYERLYK